MVTSFREQSNLARQLLDPLVLNKETLTRKVFNEGKDLERDKGMPFVQIITQQANHSIRNSGNIAVMKYTVVPGVIKKIREIFTVIILFQALHDSSFCSARPYSWRTSRRIASVQKSGSLVKTFLPKHDD